MGCDIHCYIEFRNKYSSEWSEFGGRINPGRNYWMFGAMAGVRTVNIPHLDPRGWPSDCAYSAFGDNTHYVSDSQVESIDDSGGSLTYSRAHAEECVSKGYCKFVNRGQENSHVTNSDHHSHSWLSPDEFEVAIAAYLKASGFQINTPRLPAPESMDAIAVSVGGEAVHSLSCITEYWPILAALRCFEAQGKESRLVFWFDN